MDDSRVTGIERGCQAKSEGNRVGNQERKGRKCIKPTKEIMILVPKLKMKTVPKFGKKRDT